MPHADSAMLPRDNPQMFLLAKTVLPFQQFFFNKLGELPKLPETILLTRKTNDELSNLFWCFGDFE